MKIFNQELFTGHNLEIEKASINGRDLYRLNFITPQERKRILKSINRIQLNEIAKNLERAVIFKEKFLDVI
jgi:hypothetical protein